MQRETEREEEQIDGIRQEESTIEERKEIVHGYTQREKSFSFHWGTPSITLPSSLARPPCWLTRGFLGPLSLPFLPSVCDHSVNECWLVCLSVCLSVWSEREKEQLLPACSGSLFRSFFLLQKPAVDLSVSPSFPPSVSLFVLSRRSKLNLTVCLSSSKTEVQTDRSLSLSLFFNSAQQATER